MKIKRYFDQFKIKIAFLLLKNAQIYDLECVDKLQILNFKYKNTALYYTKLDMLCYNNGGSTENDKKEVSVMFTVFDIANWFLNKESMTHKKLQKLCYYAQAWSWTLRNQPICEAKFEAWVHGPVCPELYTKYSGSGLSLLFADSEVSLDSNTEELLEDVWETYGHLTANALEALTHKELPWVNARKGCEPSEACNNVISVDDMKQYYRSIYIGNDLNG